MNRTGTASVPLLGREMLEGASDGAYGALGDAGALACVRGVYAREADAIGSPLRASSGTKLGPRAIGYLDELSAMVAFERYCVRLYELVLVKVEACAGQPSGPLRQELTSMRADEIAHFELAHGAMARLGGDPTALSPRASVLGVVTSGFGQALADPRVDLVQCMHVLLRLELIDGEQWAMLLEQAINVGDHESIGLFRRANAAEERHVSRLRAWVSRNAGRAGREGRPSSDRAGLTAQHGVRS